MFFSFIKKEHQTCKPKGKRKPSKLKQNLTQIKLLLLSFKNVHLLMVD